MTIRGKVQNIVAASSSFPRPMCSGTAISHASPWADRLVNARVRSRKPGSRWTPRWREMDSNFRSPVGPLGEADPPARRLMTGSRAKTAQGNRNRGTNGPDPDYSHSYPPLRGRVRLSPVGIWRRDRYRWYSADHTRHLFVARARGIVIFRNYVADTPDRVVSAEPGYSSGRVRSAMVDGGRGCPDRSARSDARRDTQARMNAVLQIRSAPSTSQRYPEQKNCCWIAPRRRGDLLSLGHRRHI